MSNIVVIGAGPAGMMAAIVAAKAGHQVTLLEKNEKIGKKLFITGKGRCNVTNACEIEELFDMAVGKARLAKLPYEELEHRLKLIYEERKNE